MKTSALFIAATIASASAFAPTPQVKSSTALNESFFKTVVGMDLWAPISDSNNYGARGKKNLKAAALTDQSYIPAGLSKAQYEQVRKTDEAKKDAHYQKNVKKAGKFTNFTSWYLKRGTAEGGTFMKLPNRGHDMTKTKYDWSGETNQAPSYTGVGAIFGKK